MKAQVSSKAGCKRTVTMMMYQQLEAQRHFSNLGRNNVFFVLRGSPAAYPRQLKGTDTNCLVRICSAKAPPTRCLRKPTSPFQAVDSRQSSYIAHDPCCSTTKLVFPDGGMPLTVTSLLCMWQFRNGSSWSPNPQLLRTATGSGGWRTVRLGSAQERPWSRWQHEPAQFFGTTTVPMHMPPCVPRGWIIKWYEYSMLFETI